MKKTQTRKKKNPKKAEAKKEERPTTLVAENYSVLKSIGYNPFFRAEIIS